MASLKIHYDGWLKLSAGLLRALGARAGDRVEITPRDGGLVLRAKDGTKTTAAQSQPADPAPAEPSAAATPPSEARAPRRKSTSSAAKASVALPSALRGAGRRKARAAQAGG